MNRDPDDKIPENAERASRRWRKALDDDHLSFDEMSRYADGLADPEDAAAMAMHLDLCRMCRHEFLDLSALAAGWKREAGVEVVSQIDVARRWEEALAREEHLPYETLASYADRTVPKADLGSVAEHLAICEMCREEAKDLVAFRAELVPRPRPWRQNLRASIAAGFAGVATLLAVAYSIYHMRKDPHRLVVQAAPTQSMAILPLLNTNGIAEDDFLSVGIADALVTRLGQDRAWTMRPMSSTVRVERESPGVRTAAERLKVDVVLEGQFRIVDNRVRVALRSSEARTGHALWSVAVEGHRDDLLDLVDRLSSRAQWRLRGGQDVPDAHAARYSEPRSASQLAYEWYLRSRSYSGGLVREHYALQVQALRKAIELDPRFAAAHADLAIAMELGGLVRGLSGVDALAEAEGHARQAVRLDPALPAAHLALARVLSVQPHRFSEAMQQIAAAIALDPTDTRALVVVSSYFAASGDLKKARCVGDRILSVDPLSDDARIRGYWYIEATDAKEALRQSEYALAAPETVLAGHDIRGLAFILEDNFEAADREADAALALSPRHYIGKSLKAMVAAGRGHRTEAEAWLATFEDDAKRNHFSAMRVALCRARLGDRDAALTWIERAETLGHKRWYSLTRHPWLEPLRAEPRFEACLRRIKNDLDAARPEAMQAYSLACVPPREPFPRHNDADQRRSSQRRGAFHPLDGGDVVVSSCVPWQARGPRHA